MIEISEVLPRPIAKKIELVHKATDVLLSGEAGGGKRHFS